MSARADDTGARDALAACISDLQARASEVLRGQEKSAIVEIVRSLDYWTAMSLIDSRGVVDQSAAHYIKLGAGAALAPFLGVCRENPSGVPWGPSRPEACRFITSYLHQCGQLAHLLRFVDLQRYGVGTSGVGADGRVTIEIPRGNPELASLHAMAAWRLDRSGAQDPRRADRAARRGLAKRMRRYVGRDATFLIRYDNDMEIVDHYYRLAKRSGIYAFEGEALPGQTRVGDRTFDEWKDACDRAHGRILCHIDFALLLAEKHRDLNPRDLFTMFSRRDDTREVWRESGTPADQIDPILDALGLAERDLPGWAASHEIPTPFYVELDPDFLLLPCFGALTNPYFSLFRHLKSVHRRDWDRGLDRREDVFRADLKRLFPAPRFEVPDRGFPLRRPDGTILTDIDAIVVDKLRGSIGLFQLKWHDVYGRSLAERESRRLNLEAAKLWVAKVKEWSKNGEPTDVSRALGLGNLEPGGRVSIFVLARYSANFTGSPEPEARDTWLSWPELLQAMSSEAAQRDPLVEIGPLVTSQRESFENEEDVRERFDFRGLSVDLAIH